MTKRHFTLLARALTPVLPLLDAPVREHLLDALITLCRDANPRFDAARFRAACDL